MNVVDVSYGGENGFNQASPLFWQCLPPAHDRAQAIELSTDILANVKFIQEKKLIAK